MDFQLVLQSIFWYFESYLGVTEHIHVLWILYVYYRTYTCISDLTCILLNLYLCTGLILVLQILYLCYRTDSCILDKEVPVGTPEQIQRYIHIFILILYSYVTLTIELTFTTDSVGNLVMFVIQ